MKFLMSLLKRKLYRVYYSLYAVCVISGMPELLSRLSIFNVVQLFS